MNQIEIDFETKSPINKERLGKQAREICDYLLKGNKLNCYSYPNGFYNSSRLSEIRKFLLTKGIELKSKMITIEVKGEKISIKEHWI